MTAEARRYRVEHRTAYRYSAPVVVSYQQLHLSPRATPHQRVLRHAIAIDPEPAERYEAEDAFGNATVQLAIESSHDALDVTARSLVELTPRPRPDPAATPPWEAVREALAFRAGRRPAPDALAATMFLYESRHVRVKRDLRAFSADCFAPGRPVLAAAEALMARIHDEFEFDPKATTVSTSVMSFFAQRRGVCQDFAHFMVSCLRSVGLAARYVSGYLLTRPPPGKPRLVGADASHAWVALFVPGSGWLELDPTNAVAPGVEHITLGWGRDFADVTPLRGVIHGGGGQSLKVEVTVEPVPPSGPPTEVGGTV
ncbi:MAG TPA: transglutaminase family protein [Polyangiaceae bacterium]|nr:transglutaminase family protein [Polyangiaceae bacterium]